MIAQLKYLALGFYSLLKGLKVTLFNIFKPPITLNYPLVKQAAKVEHRGMVDLIPEKCVVCYQCIKICPVAALELRHVQTVGADNKKKLEITKFTFNGELCCYCGLCDEICPTEAMYMNQMYEVTAVSHEEINNIDLMDPKKYENLINSKPKIGS